MTRLPPLSREAAERDAGLRRLINQSQAEHDAMAPVDRALADVDQRNSFVRSQMDSSKCDDPASVLAVEVRRLRRALGPIATAPIEYSFGRLVAKHRGSEWAGRVCGVYSTAMTNVGYAVESEAHRGSVQIYPAAALSLIHTALDMRNAEAKK